jgi:alkaline phosphatase
VGDHPLGRVVDLIFGGGRCHFLPNTTEGSCRDDDTDVISMAKKNGFNYIDNREAFDNLDLGASIKLPMLGLFASKDIPYEIDRRNQNDVYPSLDEMARTALHALSAATKNSEKGFFIMIEGSRIDHAGHANDPAAQVHEVVAYDKAFASVVDFLDDPAVPGVAISTSDHETGGLATARQLHYDYPEYLWHPSALANASASSEELTMQLAAFDRGHDAAASRKGKVMELIQQGLGVVDASDSEIDTIATAEDYLHVQYGFSDLISRRAQNGWSTHGHSAADVNIYASDPFQSAELRGNHENTEVGNFLRDYLDLELESITEELKKADFYKGAEIQGTQDGRPLVMPVDHYEGDFRKREADCECGMRHVY